MQVSVQGPVELACSWLGRNHSHAHEPSACNIHSLQHACARHWLDWWINKCNQRANDKHIKQSDSNDPQDDPQ